MDELNELVEARRRFPVGDSVHGRVSTVPWGPGRAGLFVDLGSGSYGFVDVLHLPEDPKQWPPVGHEGCFEVLPHQPRQIRLSPLDAEMRSTSYRLYSTSAEEWAAIIQRYPIGSVITGVVTDVAPRTLEYSVRFEDVWSTAEYNEIPPVVGTVGSYVVTRLLQSIRQVRVEPGPEPTH
jgi:hypothetical protein